MLPLPTQLFTKDVAASVAFYKKIGFQLQALHPETPPHDSAMMTGGLTVILFELLPEESTEVEITQTLNLKVTGLDAFVEYVRGSAKILMEPHLTESGTKRVSLMDNNGYVLNFEEG